MSAVEKRIDDGINLFNKMDYSKAIEIFNEVILEQKNKKAYLYRGLCNQALYNQETDTEAKYIKYKEVLGDFDASILLDSSYKEAFLHRGIIKNLEGYYKEALEDLDISINQLSYHIAKAFQARGYIQYNLKEFGQAIIDFTKAIELDVSNGQFYFDRAISQRRIFNYHKAIEDLNKACEFTDSSNKQDLDKIFIEKDLTEKMLNETLYVHKMSPQYMQDSIDTYQKEVDENKKKITRYTKYLISFLLSIIILFLISTTFINKFILSPLSMFSFSFTSLMITIPGFALLKSLYARNQLIEKIIIRTQERVFILLSCISTNNIELKKQLDDDVLNKSILATIYPKSDTKDSIMVVQSIKDIVNFIKKSFNK